MNNIFIRDEIIVSGRIADVWEAIRNPRMHAAWHPFLTHIEGEHEIDAVRKCEVKVGRKIGHTEERCVACDPERKILWRIENDTTGFSRMVSDWRAGFTLEPKDSRSTLVIAESTFRPKRVLVRMMMPVIRRKFHDTQRLILAGLKHYSEKTSRVMAEGPSAP